MSYLAVICNVLWSNDSQVNNKDTHLTSQVDNEAESVSCGLTGLKSSSEESTDILKLPYLRHHVVLRR